MIYGSVCSGIEAATMAWHPLGWRPSFFSEIDDFPRAVLSHHYQDVPLRGDFTEIQRGDHDAIDLLVGGTPCQSFSIAGLRGGLGDDRGNLALEYLRLAKRLRARWLAWENVPGVLSSNEGRDFGAIIGGMVELGYGVAYRVLDAQYVRTLPFPWAVPQRRRRVFVVGYLGDWRPAAAVLFDRESLSGNPPPRREAGQNSAPTLSARTRGGGGLGTDFDLGGGLVTDGWPADVAPTLNAAFGDKQGLEDQHALSGGGLFVPARRLDVVAQAIAFDTTQITSAANYSNPKPGDPCHPLAAGAHPPAVALDMRGRDGGAMPEGSHEAANIRAASGGSSRSYVAQPYSIMPMNSGKDYKASEADVAQPLMAGGPVGGNQGGDFIASRWAVRRLTPRECERLQGFPDDFTSIPWRGKDHAPDGRRYKALGNSMAVNVMQWLGERIALVDGIREAS